MSRFGTRAAVVSAIAIAAVALAPVAAHAQVDLPGTDVPSVGGGGGGSLPDPGTVTEPIQGVTDPIIGGDGGIGDVTDPITGGGDDPIGGITDPIKEATDPITNSHPVGDTGDAVNDTIGGVGGGGSLLDPLEGSLGGSNPDGQGTSSGKNGKGPSVGTGTGYHSGLGFDAGGLRAGGSSSTDGRIRTIVQQPASGFEGSDPSVVAQIAQAAVEAVKKLAFPLALLAIVGAFLVLQGRLDRKDPKLAAAPVDAEQDTLSFR